MKMMFLMMALGMTALPTAQPQRGLPSTSTPAPPCGCSIEVTVQHPDGRPISDVRITVSGAEVFGQDTPVPEPVGLTTTTDAAGRAVFPIFEKARMEFVRNVKGSSIPSSMEPQSWTLQLRQPSDRLRARSRSNTSRSG